MPARYVKPYVQRGKSDALDCGSDLRSGGSPDDAVRDNLDVGSQWICLYHARLEESGFDPGAAPGGDNMIVRAGRCSRRSSSSRAARDSWSPTNRLSDIHDETDQQLGVLPHSNCSDYRLQHFSLRL
jgi:hypothetical protein